MPFAPPLCMYDAKGCYQKNPEHFKKYSHPEKDRKAATAAAAIPAAAKKPMVQPKLSFTPKGLPLKEVLGAPHILGDEDEVAIVAAPSTIVAVSSIADLHPTPPSETIAAFPSSTRGKRDRGEEVEITVMVPATTAVAASPTATAATTTTYQPSSMKQPSVRAASTSRAGSVHSTTDSITGGAEAATLLAAPTARTSSVLRIKGACSKTPASAVSLSEVYEMPFPVDQMDNIIKLAVELNPSDPCRAFPGCRLVGPFQVLCGYQYSSDAEKWTHWRCRYDPPEVQTVLVATHCSEAITTALIASTNLDSKKTRGSLHFGLHRDDPKQLPGMVVTGSAAAPFFKPLSDNIVHAIMKCVEIVGGGGAKDILGKLRKLSPESPTAALAPITKRRNKECVAKTLSGLGVHVPYEKKNELGYRDPMYSTTHFMGLIAASNNSSKGMTPKQQEELYEQYRYADIANDECDFGLSLELGLNMLTAVKTLNPVAMNTHRILDTAYTLLDRDLFGHILQCHMPVLVGRKESGRVVEEGGGGVAAIAADGTLH